MGTPLLVPPARRAPAAGPPLFPPSGMPVPDDSALLPRIRAGDRDAFEALFRAHYPDLCRFAASRVGSPDAAEDVVQEVFFRVWSRRAEWEVTGSVRAYLYGAVCNRALNLLEQRETHRRGHERAGREGSAPGMGEAQPAADERLQAEESAAEVRRAVAALPERAREVVTLRWQHGLRYAEIAGIMGISVKGVENQLARSLRALREHLHEGTA